MTGRGPARFVWWGFGVKALPIHYNKDYPMSEKPRLHFAVPTKNIPLPVPGDEEVSFDVRGVSLPDLSALMQKHARAITALYSKYAKGDADFEKGLESDVAAALIAEVPALVASIIAQVSDGVMDDETAARLPLPVQTDALVSIGELTFSGEGALEKFMAAAVRIAEGLAATMMKVNSPIPHGTGT